MSMFGPKKNKSSEGSELVLAYLEDAHRVRAAMTLMDAKGRQVGAHLTTVAEDRVALALQSPLTADKGATLSLLFILDGLRFKVSAPLLELKPGTAVLDLPSSIALAERRSKSRARLNSREGATATALTGLFDGVGIFGSIENISETGVCIRVDRAMEVKTQRKMHMSANLMPVGQPLMLIKLAKLPKCPPIELEGRVAFMDASQGLVVGIAFETGKASLLAPIKALVASRTSAIPSSVPMKTRRQPEVPRETREEHQPAEIPEPPPEPAPAARPAPSPAAPPAPPREEPEPDEAEAHDDRSLALLAMKKRSRGILLAMPEGPDRDLLAAFLSEDGYGRVPHAGTLTELLEHLDLPGTHLIFVDGGVAELQSLALASLLRHRMGEDMPPVILAEDAVDAELVLGARETGVAQVLVKPYQLDRDFTRMLEEHLGIG